MSGGGAEASTVTIMAMAGASHYVYNKDNRGARSIGGGGGGRGWRNMREMKSGIGKDVGMETEITSITIYDQTEI